MGRSTTPPLTPEASSLTQNPYAIAAATLAAVALTALLMIYRKKRAQGSSHWEQQHVLLNKDVRISGLKGKIEYNGRSAFVVAYHEAQGRLELNVYTKAYLATGRTAASGESPKKGKADAGDVRRFEDGRLLIKDVNCSPVNLSALHNAASQQMRAQGQQSPGRG